MYAVNIGAPDVMQKETILPGCHVHMVEMHRNHYLSLIRNTTGKMTQAAPDCPAKKQVVLTSETSEPTAFAQRVGLDSRSKLVSMMSLAGIPFDESS